MNFYINMRVLSETLVTHIGTFDDRMESPFARFPRVCGCHSANILCVSLLDGAGKNLLILFDTSRRGFRRSCSG